MSTTSKRLQSEVPS